jgi:hypothetical protein
MDEGLITSLLDAVGNTIHGPRQRAFFSVIGIGRTVSYGGEPLRVDHPAKRGGSLRTEGALVDRATGITLNMEHLVAPGIDQLGTADGTIRADAGTHVVGVGKPRLQRTRMGALRRRALRVFASQLFGNRPVAPPGLQTLPPYRGSPLYVTPCQSPASGRT